MPQIHLHAEPGDYAPVVLLPGDPNRATRIAARFDGGVEASRLVNVPSRPARLHGQGRRRPRLRADDDDGRPDHLDRRRGAPDARRDHVHPRRDHGRLRAHRDRRRRRGHGGGRVDGRRQRPRWRRGHGPDGDLDVVLALVAAARAVGLTTHVGPVVTARRVLRPEPGRRRPLGPSRLPVGRDGDRRAVPPRDARTGEGPAGARRLHPDRVRRDRRPGRSRRGP